jgi:hypothetical protein
MRNEEWGREDKEKKSETGRRKEETEGRFILASPAV